MVLAAAVVCLGGLALAYERLGEAMRSPAGPRRRRGLAFGAALAALAVWCTHFLAMVGYRPDLNLNYDAALTVASFVIIVGGALLGVAVARAGSGWPWRVLGALTFMGGVCAMHFVGMYAVATDRPLSWHFHDVGVAVWGGMALAAAAACASRLERWRAPTVVGLAVLAICVLHFVAMSGLNTPVVTDAGQGVSNTVLLTGVAGGLALIIVFGAAGTAVSAWMRLSAMGQLHQAIAAMPDGLGFYDKNDRLMIWNDRYAEVNPEVAPHLRRGIRFEDLVRVGMGQDLYGEALGREEEWLARRLALRASGDSDFEQQLSDGRWLRVKDRRSSRGGTVTVSTDITPMKRDAIALAEARDAAEAANHAKSLFLANMSHEIRTPLNGVIGLSQALARTDLDVNQRQMLDLIQSSSHTLKALLSDILDLARVESGRLDIADEAFDLGEAVEEAAHLYAATAREKGLQFFVQIAPDARGWIRGDIVRVKQVLTNLISNAVKFTSHGLVSLTVERIEAAEGATLRFAVQDTGIGFTEDQKSRLFGRFEQADGAITRQYGGSGLGLAICQQLSLMMGGALDCESQLGGGSTFFLTLPFRAAEAPAPVVHAEAMEASQGTTRVLLADDHPTNRRVVELILQPFDLDLTIVENGAEAVAAFRQQPFDLVLMDMQMPVMDGLTATQEIRRHEDVLGLARTPLVMLTANALPEHVAAGHAAGADGHLSKPFSAEDLIALVADPMSALRAAQPLAA
ncbi:hypothetical protein ASG17_06220 [Brevundimonas sp. Leaf363]|nr:hypothetical protein ASG17_06220 [Brevundimonas sp. Leaf363]